MAEPEPSPPAGRPECDPVYASPPTDAHVFFQNAKRPLTNYINAKITAAGYFHYDVVNEPADGLGCPGSWLFEQAWEHFRRCGVAVQGIRGDWTFGTNLQTVNRLTASGTISLEEAARHPDLWAFRQAASRGFSHVLVLESDGQPGPYLSVDVVYLA